MAKARVFQSGNSQAVRLPKAFRFDVKEVEIFRRGNEVVLRGSTLPARVMLQPNAPNPFNPRTTLRFQLPRSTHAELRIFDVAGRTIRTLVDERLPAGTHTLIWDGTDVRGARVPTGIYFAELRGAGESRRIRMNLLK